MKTAIALASALGVAGAAVAAPVFTPGSYFDASGRPLYAALDVEDDGPVVNWLDPASGKYGVLPESPDGWRLAKSVAEKRITVKAPEGDLGASLYYSDDTPRATVILIHGNEAQTREMGYLIPLFVLNGVNVASYDQRGMGESSGQWRTDGPEQRAVDVDALYDALSQEHRVDANNIGLWAFSNGGWSAPLVARDRAVTFMILVGAPAESVSENICFEARQRVLHAGFDDEAANSATETVRAYLNAALGKGSWEQARMRYTHAAQQQWFAQTGLRPGAEFPLAPDRVELIRRTAGFDPASVLKRTRVPTLAMFGVLDRSVDAEHDSAIMRESFKAAGMRDFTLQMYPKAGHSLVVSDTGYEDEPSQPLRLAPGYPMAMIDWLRQRRLATIGMDSIGQSPRADAKATEERQATRRVGTATASQGEVDRESSHPRPSQEGYRPGTPAS